MKQSRSHEEQIIKILREVGKKSRPSALSVVRMASQRTPFTSGGRSMVA